MVTDTWQIRSPGDLSIALPAITADDPAAAIARACAAFPAWRSLEAGRRWDALVRCRERLEARSEDLARLIAREIGKPLCEARQELAAVIAKFELTEGDARVYAAPREVSDGPHPAQVRLRPRGPAAVIAPFNFPIHLAHGAALAYLLAGNTVLFKPSPLAGNTGAAYAEAMQESLPNGIFEVVQGQKETARAIALDPRVRAACFTGSVGAGFSLARDLASDPTKSLALELGGVNSIVVCDDADLSVAAEAAADALCLTTGQRCNATRRILVHRSVAADFTSLLVESLRRYQPGDPMSGHTLLGPLVSEAARERFREALDRLDGEWLVGGGPVEEADGRKGWYVKPAVLRISEDSFRPREEIFAPLAFLEIFDGEADAIARHNASPDGLVASVFCASEGRFRRLADSLEAGNLYWNLPTTASPSTLPFGGWKASGNGMPGGRGFIRFAGGEQALQWRK